MNSGNYFYNLRFILKEKQECLEYYQDSIKLNNLQKANFNYSAKNL